MAPNKNYIYEWREGKSSEESWRGGNDEKSA